MPINFRNLAIGVFFLVCHTFVKAQDTLEIIPTDVEQKIFSAIDQIKNNPALHTNNIDPSSMPSLPVGLLKSIGENVYCIAIDSAVFKTDRAYFSAYTAIDFPGTTKKLAFAAKNINFGPAGIRIEQGLKLQLVSDNLIHFGSKIDLFLAGDGTNYVEFDCNGYKQLHLKGTFIFKGDILKPLPPANGGQTPRFVTADFEVTVEDISNIFASIDFSPFMIKGMEDFKFDVGTAAVDFSDFQNPSATLPTSFLATLDGEVNAWRGFYLSSLQATLPEKFNKTGNSPTTINIQNLFIDKSGITGNFSVDNVLSIGEGDASGWGLSIYSLGMSLQSNKLVGGSIEGSIKIPLLKDGNNELDYSAALWQDQASPLLHYNFTIGFANNVEYEIEALQTKLTFYNTSVLSLSDHPTTHKLFPELVLNGKISIGNNSADLKGISFTNMVLNPTAPYIHSGTFGLVGLGIKFAGFSISLTQFGIHKNIANKELFVDVGFGITFGEGSTTFAGAAAFSIVSKYQVNGPSDNKLHYDRFLVNSIHLEAHTTVFEFIGDIVYKENDLVFGKLYYGSLSLKVSALDSPIIVRAGFGKITDAAVPYKYWYADAQVPVNIPVSYITLSSFMGGASYHVKPTKTNLELMQMANSVSMDKANGQTPAPQDPNAIIPFVPDKNFGLGLRAGVGFNLTGKDDVLNGQVIFSILLNSNGGLANVNFSGEGFMLVKTQDRYNENVQNKIHATISLNYDVEPKIFDANITGDMRFAGCIDGSLWVKIHFQPGQWYIWCNKPDDRATINVRTREGAPFFSAGAYFQLGNVLSPLGTLPPWASNISNTAAARSFDSSKMASGTGVLTGMHAGINFGGDYHVYTGIKNRWYASFSAGVNFGFDLSIIKYNSSVTCNGSSDFGMNRLYCQGSVYFAASASAGGKRVNKNDENDIKTFNLFSASFTGLLSGQFPKPTYVSGAIAAELVLLDVININYNFEFSKGEACTFN